MVTSNGDVSLRVSASCFLALLPGNEFRKMEESDTDDCAKLHEKAMGFNRANEINVGDSSFVVTRDGSIMYAPTAISPILDFDVFTILSLNC